MKFNYPVPSHFQFSGRDGTGTWKKVRDGSGTGIPSDPGYDKLKCWCRWRCSEMKMNHSWCTLRGCFLHQMHTARCTTLRITLLHTSWVLPFRLPDEKLFIDHFQPNVHKFSCSIFVQQFFTTWTRFDIRSYDFANSFKVDYRVEGAKLLCLKVKVFKIKLRAKVTSAMRKILRDFAFWDIFRDFVLREILRDFALREIFRLEGEGL